jgi:DNA polymerase-1
MNRAYIAYAASDPVLTYRVWNKLRAVVQRNRELYDSDFALQIACDKLTRRAMRVDVAYTRKLDAAFLKHAKRMMLVADKYGCHNINSTVQVAQTLLDMGVRLSTLTKSGAYQVDGKVLRSILAINKSFEVQEFVHAVLAAKQVLKRQASYTSHFLKEMDAHERVHPSINILGARTARMSVSNPPLQQLPTKDRADEL